MTSLDWRQRVGSQRDWIWRGWQIRYTFLRSPHDTTPVMLLHGFGASIGQWRENLPVLAEHHPVYALDLLGFGDSQKAAAPYEIAFWAEQVYEFWHTFIGRPVALVGHSLGSVVCLALAARYPDMVSGVVMITLPDSSVLESPQWARQAIATASICARPIVGLAKWVFTSPLVFNPVFRVIRSPRVIRLWARQAYSSADALTDEIIDIFSRPAFDSGAAVALRSMINPRSSIAIDCSAKTLLPGLQIPMLLLWGKFDTFVPPKLAPLFVRCNPALEFIEIDRAGHCPHDERPDIVNQILLDWLTKLERAAIAQPAIVASNYHAQN